MPREADAREHGPDYGDSAASEAGPLRVALTVDHPRLVLGPTLSRLPDATVRSGFGLGGRPASLTFFEIAGVQECRIGDALSKDHTVTDCRCVANGDRGQTYRVRVTAAAISLNEPAAERGIEIQSGGRVRNGWRLQLSVPDREALRDFREYCIDRGVDVSVDRLCEVDEWTSRAPALSERHRETLRAALEEGYFEIPRAGTQDDVGEQLEISGSAVSQRLRRATGELVARTFCETEDEWDDSPAIDN